MLITNDLLPCGIIFTVFGNYFNVILKFLYLAFSMVLIHGMWQNKNLPFGILIDFFKVNLKMQLNWMVF
jgi:hypothetical protein